MEADIGLRRQRDSKGIILWTLGTRAGLS